MRIVFLLVIFLAVSLPACKGAYAPPNAPDTMVQAQCRFYYRCCNATERESVADFYSAPHSSEKECNEELGKLFRAYFAPYVEAVKEGRADWDKSAAKDCGQPFEEAAKSCDAKVFLDPYSDDTCDPDSWLIGQVGNGEDCFLSEECADVEASCVPKVSTNPDVQLVTEAGTCKGPGEVGECCGPGCPDGFRRCRTTLYCDYVAEKCTARKSSGDACDVGAQECQEGLFCDWNTATCQALRPVGQPCNDTSECEPDLFCDWNNSQCAAKLANGQACNTDEQCVSDDCDWNTDLCQAPGSQNVVYEICEG